MNRFKLMAYVLCVLAFSLPGAPAARKKTPASEPGVPAVTNVAPAAPSSAVVYSIPIRGMIEPALLYVIRRGVFEAQSAGADAIVFVMDTPGGTLDAASEIVHTIQQITIPTYTFVEKDAFSAGAIIALATKHIYMAPGTRIGDAMPIMMTPFGGVQAMPEDMKEKAVSAVCAIIRSAAESGGHNKELAEKMVRREIEFKIGDEVISPAGQLLTLTNVEAERRIGGAGEPLLSEGTVRDLDELLERVELKGATVKELRVTTSERIARLIAAAAPLFLMAGLLGIYIEIKTPGFGLPGILGILSLAIFFWGHHIAGLAGMEDILLFAAGVLLLLIEIFIIPGFGIVGVTGIFLMLWAVLNAMVQRGPGSPWFPSWPQMQLPLLKLSGALVGSAVVIGLIARFLPKTAFAGRLILHKATSRDDGFTASLDTKSLLGTEGTSLSPLRPAGAAMFGERKLDVVTRGEFIDGGRRIRIVESHGSRIVVEACGDKPT